MRLLLIIASLIPVALLVGYGGLKTHARWTNRALWFGFGVGAGMGVLVFFGERWLVDWLDLAATDTLYGAAKKAFLTGALPEELAKFVVVLVIVVRFLEGRRLQDVLLLSLGVSLGFATLTNALYLGLAQSWQDIAFVRAVSAVPAHGMFGLAMGGLVIATVLADSHRLLGLLMALAAPILFHGAFETLLTLTGTGVVAWKFPAIVLVMAFAGLSTVGLCNMVLPEAASFDQHGELEPPLKPGRLPKVLSYAARTFLAVLIGIAYFSGFDATICWMCGFLGVLPLILAIDLIITKTRERDLLARA